MKLKLLRTFANEHKTLGLLRLYTESGITDSRIKTLELPDKDNQRYISRIPAGVYPIKPIKRPNGDWALLLENVPNRYAILIHRGNYTRHIQGCILVGLKHVDIDKDGITDVAQSREAMDILEENIKEPTTIEIRDTYNEIGCLDPKTEPKV